MTNDRVILQGEAAAYTISSTSPFAFGRTSTCYQGESATGEAVCVKLYNRVPKNDNGLDAIDEFASEIRARKRLAHPHILPITDFGLTNPITHGPFLVLPLCEKDLRDRMQQSDFIPLPEALPLLRQLASAVDFAHAAGILHGDIKPENILFGGGENRLYLSDFGVSRFFSFNEKFTTASFGTTGTTVYLSPEQLRDGIQSPQSDIYSFALVAYEMLCGRLPFHSHLPLFKQMLDKINGVLIDPLDSPSLPPAVRDGLLQGLHSQRADRPVSAAALCDALTTSAPARRKGATRGPGFWASLDSSTKSGILLAVIAGLFGLAAALVQIIPDLLENAKPAAAAAER